MEKAGTAGDFGAVSARRKAMSAFTGEVPRVADAPA
jgi:hypothetical protein